MTIAVRQEVQNSQTATGTSIAVAITPLTGSYLHVTVALDNTIGTITSVTDGTNTYTQRTGFRGASEGLAVYTTGPVTAGTYTVTANFGSSTTFIGIAIAEITGTSGWITGAGQAQATVTTAANAVTTGVTGPVIQTPALVYGICLSGGDSSANTVGSGFTVGAVTGFVYTAGTTNSEYMVYNSGAPVAATWTASSTASRLQICGVWAQTGGVMATSVALTSTANSAATPALPLSTRTGDAGVAFVQTLSAQPLTTFTDLAGNTWNGTGAPAFNVSINGVHFYIYLLWAQNITGHASEVYTASISNGPILIVVNVMLFSGRATTGSLFDGSVGTASDSSGPTSHPGPSVTTTFRNSDLAMMAWDASQTSDTFSASSGFSIATQNLGSSSTYFPSFAQYQTLVPAGTYAGAFTTANAVNSGAIMVALLNAPSTGGSSGLTLLGVG